MPDAAAQSSDSDDASRTTAAGARSTSIAAAAAAVRLVEELGLPFERDAALGAMTWYGVGGRAAVLAKPTTIEQLIELRQTCVKRGVAFYTLGSGANLLVRNAGVTGVVVKLDQPAFQQVSRQGDSLIVASGADMAKLTIHAAREGLAGIACMAGIPASVGGAVRMNAGGRFGAIGDVVRRVTMLQPDGSVIDIAGDAMQFAYRHSAVGDATVLEVELALTPDDPAKVRDRVKEIFAYKKASQPMAAHSAGCAFKNPPVSDDGVAPAPAGKLIDDAGLKGFRIGGAFVSPQHANFVAADRGASADDIAAVMKHVQDEVAKQAGIELVREVVIWP